METIAAIFIFSFVILLLVLLGIIFSLGRGSGLIAGFNTMAEEEKNKYDVIALCKFMGKAMFAVSFSMLLCLIGMIYESDPLLYLEIALAIAISLLSAIYSNVGSRFKKGRQ